MKTRNLSFLAALFVLTAIAHGQHQLAGSITLSNTAGAGFVQIANQSSAPATPTAAGRLYFDAGNDLAWKEAGGFIGKIDLGGAARTVTLSGSPTLGDWFDQSVKTTASPTLAALTLTAPLTGANGGTGVANTGKTITLGGNLTTAGAFDTTLTVTAGTGVTLPTTGTLATLAGAEALSNKTITASAFNGTVGATTPAAGSFTTLGASGNATITGGVVSLDNASGTVITAVAAGVYKNLQFRGSAIDFNPSNGGVVVSVTSTGAAVTGTISATGTITVGSSPPANAGAAGTAGTITWDADYLYICVAANTWKRVAIATWP